MFDRAEGWGSFQSKGASAGMWETAQKWYNPVRNCRGRAMAEQDRNRLLNAWMDMARLMLESGAGVRRVEDTLNRLGSAYGASMNALSITSHISATALFADGTSVSQTRRVSSSRIDLLKVERLNALSRECASGEMAAEEIESRLRDIDREMPLGKYLAGAALGASAFAVFFDGGAADAAAAAVFGVISCLITRLLSRYSSGTAFVNLISSFVSGVLIYTAAGLIPALNADMISIGVIMLMIPGLSITNAIRDMFVGDTITGALRFLECLLWAAALAAGFALAMGLVGGLM